LRFPETIVTAGMAVVIRMTDHRRRTRHNFWRVITGLSARLVRRPRSRATISAPTTQHPDNYSYDMDFIYE
jgi:hypothetical protein